VPVKELTIETKLAVMKQLIYHGFIITMCILMHLADGKKINKGKEIKFSSKGDVNVNVRYHKWKDPKERTFCCPLSIKHCKLPCKGLSCSATCTLSCGFFDLYPCAPVSCSVANPFGCVQATTTTTAAAATCPSGWTASPTNNKCFKASTTDGDWLVALTDCLSQGGTLAKIENAAENTAVQNLLGGQIGWIGLQDFKVEGTFSWADDTPLGAYTNWLAGQPDNNGVGQHCVSMRADGTWNDVICNGDRPYVCQRPL